MIVPNLQSAPATEVLVLEGLRLQEPPPLLELLKPLRLPVRNRAVSSKVVSSKVVSSKAVSSKAVSSKEVSSKVVSSKVVSSKAVSSKVANSKAVNKAANKLLQPRAQLHKVARPKPRKAPLQSKLLKAVNSVSLVDSVANRVDKVDNASRPNGVLADTDSRADHILYRGVH